MKVLFVTSFNCACGIATYSSNLIEQLEAQGCRVEVFSDTKNFTRLVKLAKDCTVDVVHIQHEFGISLPTEALLSVIGKFKSTGKSVVVTPHTETPMFNIVMDGVADAVILHNDADRMCERSTFSRFYRIPHGIPEVVPSAPISELRAKYGMPENAFVIGTCGFLSPDRGNFIENTVLALTPFVREHPDVWFHIATSRHRGDIDGNYAGLVYSTLTKLAREQGFANRFVMTKDFMPVQEFRDRLCTFSVGMARSSAGIMSNSGAAADMVSCKVPVVVNRVPHFSHITKCCEVLDDVDGTPAAIVKLYKDRGRLAELSVLASEVVTDLGYSVVAKKHIQIYESLKAAAHAAPLVKKETVKAIKTEIPITVTCPNSMWQVLLLWKKLSHLVDCGHRIQFQVQNDGLTDLTVLKFVLKGFQDVQFLDVGLGHDSHMVRLFSRSLSQNMVTDVERWFEDGHTFKDIFGYDLPSDDYDFTYPMDLGEFSERRVDRLRKQLKNALVIHVSDSGACTRVPHLVRMFPDNVVDSIVIMGSPLQQVAVNALYTILYEQGHTVTKVIEDIRTRWAICKHPEIFTVLTPWDEIAAFCLVQNVQATYDLHRDWQRKLVFEIGKPMCGIVLHGADGHYYDASVEPKNPIPVTDC